MFGLNLLLKVNVGLFIGLGVLVVFIALVIGFVPLRVWFRALVSGAHVSMVRLLGMKLRKQDYKSIVSQFIISKKAGLNISIGQLETHSMAGGRIDKVVAALVAAYSAKLDLSIDEARAIDLAGRDVLEAVTTSVSPRVIITPEISAIAKDGIELHVKARITVKSKMDRQIGGADENTIIARVGEGIVAAVGSAERNSDILANPSLISEKVYSKGLDRNTAFEILSVDIADIDVGRNVGAQLSIEDAEAKKRISQAKAEEKRMQAVALEQEMKAKTQEMKALVLAAESEIPKAMAQAFRNGQIGVLDYYKMQNLNADTKMRNAFADKDKKDGEEGDR
ncbi:MAG: flotillin-like protein FloA [Clostridia bacterium]|nr:flotillin-like protein FloA [Clostridia bacterium]